MILNKQQALDKIFNYLDIHSVDVADLRLEESDLFDQHISSGDVKKSINRWKEELDSADIELILKCFHDYMAEFYAK